MERGVQCRRRAELTLMGKWEGRVIPGPEREGRTWEAPGEQAEGQTRGEVLSAG